MTFEKLEKNLMDVVLEEQAKLGFRREKIRLYYPLSTLNHIFDCCIVLLSEGVRKWRTVMNAQDSRRA